MEDKDYDQHQCHSPNSSRKSDSEESFHQNKVELSSTAITLEKFASNECTIHKSMIENQDIVTDMVTSVKSESIDLESAPFTKKTRIDIHGLFRHSQASQETQIGCSSTVQAEKPFKGDISIGSAVNSSQDDSCKTIPYHEYIHDMKANNNDIVASNLKYDIEDIELSITAEELFMNQTSSDFRAAVQSCLQHHINVHNERHRDNPESSSGRDRSSSKLNQKGYRTKLSFPTSLTANQRKVVHECAVMYGVDSRSHGSSSDRFIMVTISDDSYEDINQYHHIINPQGEATAKDGSAVNRLIDFRSVRRWSIDKAKSWIAARPWLVGCNFIVSTAVNQLEMWQKETFDVMTIRKEVQLAASLGFNVLRVYLHNLLWQPFCLKEFKENIDIFLNIIEECKMKVIFVLFDDCHRPHPKLGKQKEPVKGIHNSGWVQSPGSKIVEQFHSKEISEKERNRLENYVKGVLQEYGNDARILMWDLYNEAGQNGLGDWSFELLACVWQWADSARPSQPLTACLDGSIGDKNIAINKIFSDIITFHWYYGNSLEYRINHHIKAACGRPIICTEYMARELGTTFQLSLPLFKSHKIGAINWGLVSGKTQTIWNWETVKNLEKFRSLQLIVKPGDSFAEPVDKPWFHDIFRIDGTAYDDEEVEFIERILEE